MKKNVQASSAVHFSADSMTRRGFLGVLSASAIVAGVGLGGCSAGESASDEPLAETGDNEIVWEDEADVIVMGFGGAGGTAAIEAARQGSTVLLFEKAPEEFAGGNSSVCEGAALIGRDQDIAFENTRRLTTKTSVTDDEIKAYIQNTCRQVEWANEALGLNAEVVDISKDGHTAPWGLLDIEAGYSEMIKVPTFFTNVMSTVKRMSDLIEVHYETPVVDLVFNPVNKEVYGVTVEDSTGARKNYKANKGVVLAPGSFENNSYYIENFCYDPLPELYPLGTPYNTGDGIPLVEKVGARLRHMATLEFGAFCFRTASQEAGCTISMGNNVEDVENLIAVNKNGVRFMNEAGYTQSSLPHPGHDKMDQPELKYDGRAFEYANCPYWFVFDESRFASHALATWATEDASSGWTAHHRLYTWSNDNQAELEKGWILKGDTIAELAKKMGVDAATLEQTVADYNKGCETGSDAFGRDRCLSPVATGPFYATEMTLSFINAQGGPQRNEAYQVIDTDGNPIPRLYAAGEFGSIWGRDYHGACNVPEALCGFAAGEQVAALDPWS